MEIVTASSPGLSVIIPVFPPAARPVPGNISALDPALETAAHYPLFIPAEIIHHLIAEEVVFRQQHTAWVERAWFLKGRIERVATDIVGIVTGVLPAEGTAAAAASVAFSLSTWTTLHAGLGNGESCLGWIHTHSVAGMWKACSAQEGEQSTGEQAADGARSDTTGLFLSALDINAARESFRAPFQLTAVLDSDAALRLWQGQQVLLPHLLAFWGWRGGHLCPRSINVVASGETRA